RVLVTPSLFELRSTEAAGKSGENATMTKHGFEYCRLSNLIVEQELERQRPLPQFKSGPGSRPGEQLPGRRVVSDRQPSDSVRRAGNAGSNPAGVTTHI